MRGSSNRVGSLAITGLVSAIDFLNYARWAFRMFVGSSPPRTKSVYPMPATASPRGSSISRPVRTGASGIGSNRKIGDAAISTPVHLGITRERKTAMPSSTSPSIYTRPPIPRSKANGAEEGMAPPGETRSLVAVSVANTGR
jgi:hypothetical protein